MGPIIKKTYSRKKHEIYNSFDKNKENIDPFDELLASPLKQNVSFKPLSCCIKENDIKLEKKSKHNFPKLFQSSDSDELSSPDPIFKETTAAINSEFSNEIIDDTLAPKKLDSTSDNSSFNNDSDSQINDTILKRKSFSSSDIKELSTMVNSLTISNDSQNFDNVTEKESTINSLSKEMTPTFSIHQGASKNNSHSPLTYITFRKRPRNSSRYLQLKKKKSINTPFSSTIQNSSCTCQIKNLSHNCCKNEKLSPADMISKFKKLQKIEKESTKNINAKSRNTLDISRLSSGFAGPIFESTRIDEGDVRLDDTELNKEEDGSFLDCTITLKPGKKWMRSMSVLRQLQNGDILSNKSKKETIKGKNYSNFVEEVSKLQNSSPSSKTFLSNTLNCSLFGRTTLNHTVKVINEETVTETNNTFAQTLRLVPKGASSENCIVSAKDFILTQCEQDDILPFEEFFNEKTLKNCEKIGEGVFGEVFKCDPDKVFKIMPIEGDDLVNGEPQKTFEQILSEIVVAAKLSNLRYDNYNQTSGFCEMKKCWCVIGKYPKFLIDLWDKFNLSGEGSENDSPVMFKSNQIFIILEFENGGRSLESFVFNSAEQSFSVFSQIALSLAVAEKAFEFEHRDLHWGNILVSRTKEKYVTIVLNGTVYKIATKGVKVCIIDFTLSRISHEGCAIYNNLAQDPSLFLSEGDYQFEIYRMMQKEVENEWWQFKPKTNLFWLHYIIDKMLKMVNYKNKKTSIHQKFKSKLQEIESVIAKYEDSSKFIQNLSFS